MTCRNCHQDLRGDLQAIVFGACSGSCAEMLGIASIESNLLEEVIARIERSNHFLTSREAYLLYGAVTELRPGDAGRTLGEIDNLRRKLDVAARTCGQGGYVP